MSNLTGYTSKRLCILILSLSDAYSDSELFRAQTFCTKEVEGTDVECVKLSTKSITYALESFQKN
jgi:hypothetical protein